MYGQCDSSSVFMYFHLTAPQILDLELVAAEVEYLPNLCWAGFNLM